MTVQPARRPRHCLPAVPPEPDLHLAIPAPSPRTSLLRTPVFLLLGTPLIAQGPARSRLRQALQTPLGSGDKLGLSRSASQEHPAPPGPRQRQRN